MPSFEEEVLGSEDGPKTTWPFRFDLGGESATLEYRSDIDRIVEALEQGRDIGSIATEQRGVFVFLTHTAEGILVEKKRYTDSSDMETFASRVFLKDELISTLQPILAENAVLRDRKIAENPESYEEVVTDYEDGKVVRSGIVRPFKRSAFAKTEESFGELELRTLFGDESDLARWARKHGWNLSLEGSLSDHKLIRAQGAQSALYSVNISATRGDEKRIFPVSVFVQREERPRDDDYSRDRRL